jgi:pimeloyl-ACP methyl ester carboxylesterase
MWSAFVAAIVLAAGIAGYVDAAPPVRDAVDALRLVAGAVLLYAGIVAVFVAAYFALAWWWRAPRPPQARIGARATLRLLWREYRAILLAPWRMIFYRQLVPDDSPPYREHALPVLLVHGVLCNAGVWSRVRDHLRDAGIRPVFALSYGPPLASIERFAGQMHDRIEAIRGRTGCAQVIVVAHSMGGLVALAYLRRFGAARIRRLVTIGTPYGGSHHAGWFPGASLAQLRPGNAWLRALGPRAPQAGPPVVSLWSWHDSMVTPQTSSILEGACNVALTGIGHNALLAEPAILERVTQEIRAAAPPPAGDGETRDAQAGAEGAGSEDRSRATATRDTCSAPGTLP